VTTHPFRQVDVFGARPLLGNPLAVVHGADDVGDDTKQLVAQWTNLSETTFLTEPTDPTADYAVRILTTSGELPFAGHPTLGSAHAWLEAGGVPKRPDRVIQECGIGLVPLRRDGGRLAFAAPSLRRSGAADDDVRARVLADVGLDEASVVDVAWVDNGPGWIGVLLDSAATVLEVRPGQLDVPVGVIGPQPDGHASQFEVRAFYPANGVTIEDPVTGSLNAGLAVWLLATGRATAPYVATQGTAIGRDGRVHVARDEEGLVWIGGSTSTIVQGSVDLP
jgi:PhzF family phenazine biosynthesis protein